jgi:hypothetical protein
MTIYHVHLYREMRLVYSSIEADSHEQAAEIASNKVTDDADEIADCEGTSLGALVDVAGDDEYEQSKMIEFEEELLRKAAPTMLTALRTFLEEDAMASECQEWKWENLEHAFGLARDVVAYVEAHCPDEASFAPVTKPDSRHRMACREPA